MWCSSNRFCELPYNVTGIVKYTGLQETSKDICKDRKNWNKVSQRYGDLAVYEILRYINSQDIKIF